MSNSDPILNRTVSRASRNNSENASALEEPHVAPSSRNNTNILLISIVSVFLACHILRFVGLYYHEELKTLDDICITIYVNATKLCKATGGNGTMDVASSDILLILAYPRSIWYVNPIAAFLLLVNSSLNFIIYVLAGTRFRKAFIRKIRWLTRACRQQDIDPNITSAGNDYATTGFASMRPRGSYQTGNLNLHISNKYIDSHSLQKLMDFSSYFSCNLFYQCKRISSFISDRLHVNYESSRTNSFRLSIRHNHNPVGSPVDV